MLDENLSRLNYKPFSSGSINSKYYSDYEALTAVGIANVDTVTKKTVKGKKVEEPDLKFCIKFKWDVDTLLNHPNLFLRYFNYFDDTKQQGQANTTTSDFMPFVYQGSYSPSFLEIIDAGEAEYDYLNEAVAPTTLDQEPSEEELGLSGFDSIDDEDAIDEPLPSDENDLYSDDLDENGTPIEGSGEAKLKASMKPTKNRDYHFYMIFKYSEDYNHSDKMKKADYHNGADIEILKLVAEGHADDNNVAITGKALEKKAIGFYRELLGILNANHRTIKRMVEIEENDYELNDYGDHEEGELDQPANGGSYDDIIDTELDSNDAGSVPELDNNIVTAGKDSVRADQVSRSDISEEAFDRFMASKGASF